MQTIAIITNATRVAGPQLSEVQWTRSEAIADLLSSILIDGTAADRWLARGDAEIGEARDAIRRLLGSARMLTRLIDQTALREERCERVSSFAPVARVRVGA